MDLRLVFVCGDKALLLELQLAHRDGRQLLLDNVGCDRVGHTRPCSLLFRSVLPAGFTCHQADAFLGELLKHNLCIAIVPVYALCKLGAVRVRAVVLAVVLVVGGGDEEQVGMGLKRKCIM